MDYALVDQTSEQFLGQWRRLVSTTNWEKGRIIHEWREALAAAAETPPAEYTDEAWSRRAGNVTPQHVGRLRRVFERFAATHDQYPGLYWSHFQAALDWEDAEMWLEGAVHSDWSIADMRAQRSEALGLAAEDAADADQAAEPWDDDAEPAEGTLAGTPAAAHASSEVESDDDAADEDAGYDHSQYEDDGEATVDEAEDAVAPPPLRPFAELPPLPADVNDAFEAYKLCILRHRLAGWQDISQEDLVASLESLRELALAPAEA